MYRIIIYGIKKGDIQPILEEQTGHGGFQTFIRKMKDQYSKQREEFILTEKIYSVFIDMHTITEEVVSKTEYKCYLKK